MEIVDVAGVSKRFGDTRALVEVDLAVPEGSVQGLLGPNGAGKTTLVRVLATLLRPDAGRVSVAGIDVLADPMGARMAIGLAGQFAAVDETLTGRENLELVGRLYRLTSSQARERAGDALERLGLGDAGDRQVRTYSGGMRRRLDLGASLVGRPKVLLLDEPTTGLDPRTRLDLWQFIRDLVGGGTTVLLTTQYLEEADRLADRIVVIDRGSVIASGTPAELKARLGGDVIDLHVAPASELERASEALASLRVGEPKLDAHEGRLTLPVSGGSQALVQAVRLLDDAGIGISDLALRQPSLDDVFLAITGSATGAEEDR